MPARSPGRLNPWGNAALLLSASSLFWAGNSIAGRLLADAVPPLTFTFWRWAVALLLITPFAWRHIRADAPALLRHWPMILGLAATGAGSFGALLYIGLQTTTALNSLVLQAAIPPIVLLLAVLILREKAGAAQMLGIAVSLIGVLVILTKGHLERLLSLSFNPGDAYILAAVLLNSGYSILLRFRPAVHPISLLWATFVGADVLLAPFLAWDWAHGRVMALNQTTLWGLAYVAVFPSFLSYLFYNRGIELYGVQRSSQFIHLTPVLGAFLAVALLGEHLDLHLALGAALIAAGIGAAAIRAPALAAVLRRRPNPKTTL